MVDDLLALMTQELQSDLASRAILAAFEEDYEPPSYDNSGICDRCSVRVFSGRRDGHNVWHRNLSLTMYLLEGFILSMRRGDASDEEG